MGYSSEEGQKGGRRRGRLIEVTVLGLYLQYFIKNMPPNKSNKGWKHDWSSQLYTQLKQLRN